MRKALKIILRQKKFKKFQLWGQFSKGELGDPVILVRWDEREAANYVIELFVAQTEQQMDDHFQTKIFCPLIVTFVTVRGHFCVIVSEL